MMAKRFCLVVVVQHCLDRPSDLVGHADSMQLVLAECNSSIGWVHDFDGNAGQGTCCELALDSPTALLAAAVMESSFCWFCMTVV